MRIKIKSNFDQSKIMKEIVQAITPLSETHCLQRPGPRPDQSGTLGRWEGGLDLSAKMSGDETQEK